MAQMDMMLDAQHRQQMHYQHHFLKRFLILSYFIGFNPRFTTALKHLNGFEPFSNLGNMEM